MWTLAIVVLTTVPDHPVLSIAWERDSEVLLDGAVGAVLHLLADLIAGHRP